MHNIFSVVPWQVAVLRQAVHHHIAEHPCKLRHVGRVDQTGEAEGIHGRLRGGCACEHPQPAVLVDQPVHSFPSLGGCSLVGRRLVDDDQVKLSRINFFLDDLNTVVVDDDELGTTVDDLLAFFGRTVSHVHRAVHSKLK